MTTTIDGQLVEVLHAGRRVYRGRLSRKAGARMLPGGVNCARPGRWGNGFHVGQVYKGRVLKAQDCVDEYWQNLSEWPDIVARLTAPLVTRYRQHGHLILYCWCRLGDPCHCKPLADAVVAELERTEK